MVAFPPEDLPQITFFTLRELSNNVGEDNNISSA